MFGYRDREATRVIVPEGVVGIGREAFAEMYDLEEVVLPSTLKYIASDAFFYCTTLDNVFIPDGVEEIGEGAFEDCSWLQTITFGAGLKRIGVNAFKGCTQLQKVVFQDGLEEISEGVFNNCFKMQSAAIPLSVTNIASTAFTGCSSLTGVTTPTHGGTMAEWFGSIYTKVKNVTVPAGEVVVVPGVFAGCSALQSVSFFDLKDSEGNVTNGVTVIGAGAFQNCSALAGATLPEALEEVGGTAFKGCTALATLAFPDGVTTLGMEVCRDCSALKELTLSRSLTAIPDRAFYGCNALDSFTVPESVSDLGSQIVSGSANWWVDNGARAIYFLGNAPSYASDVYGASRSDLVSYVVYGTRGWDGRGFVNWDELRTGVYAALANYLESKDLINVLPFDSAKTANVQLKDLGAGKVRNFILDAREKRSFKLSSRASVMDVLTALELVDDAGRICNSAALLFGKRPQRFFPTSEVKCAWFFGDHVEKPMADYQIYEGDVFELADHGMRMRNRKI